MKLLQLNRSEGACVSALPRTQKFSLSIYVSQLLHVHLLQYGYLWAGPATVNVLNKVN